jgi:hypothetical protein
VNAKRPIMLSALLVGGPVVVRYAMRADGDFSAALAIACAVLVASAALLRGSHARTRQPSATP